MRTGTVATIAALGIATALAAGPTTHADGPESLFTTVCQADLTADGIVDGADLRRLLRAYGACTDCAEDLNGDKYVDAADVERLTDHWGRCAPGGDYYDGDHRDLPSFSDLDSGAVDPGSLKGAKMHRTTTTLVAPRCRGDLNADAIVNEQDMARLLRYYGTCAACEADLNKDGFVDDADAEIIDLSWGHCGPGGDYFGGYGRPDGLAGGPESLNNSGNGESRKGTGLPEPEDVNGDTFVDMADILIVAEDLGSQPIGDCTFSDVNKDGRIDADDIRSIALYMISDASFVR